MNQHSALYFLLFLVLIFPAGIRGSSLPTMSYTVSQPLLQPRIFGEGIISTGDYDSHPTFSPDGNTLYFVKMAPDLTRWTIFESHYRNLTWTEPEIAAFSGQYWDADPYFSKDGNTLYFISNRPLKEGDPQKDFDIWKVERLNERWSKPSRLESPINSEASEYYPSISDNGTMYFGSRRKTGKGGADIWFSRLENGEYRTAENLNDSINSTGNEFEPFIAFDESFLIFMATLSESLEEADLYISHKDNGQWTKARKLPEPFNSGVAEWSPQVTRDLKYFFFASARNKQNIQFRKAETTSEMIRRIRQTGNGLGDIYQIDFSVLQKALNP